MFGVDAGTLEQKGSSCKQFWSIWRICMKRSGASRRSNVATSPRCDVPTSRRWVNQYSSQQVTTSQRRDVSTSRRGNVATWKRRDVETSRRQREICPLSLKAAKGSEFEASRGVRTRARNSREGVTPTSKKCP